MTVAVVFVRVEGEVGDVVEVCARLGVKAETERRRDGETKWEGRKVEAAEGVRVGPRVTAKPLPKFGPEFRPGLREAPGVADADDDLDDGDELGEAAEDAPVTEGRALEQRGGVVRPGVGPGAHAGAQAAGARVGGAATAGGGAGGVVGDEDGARDVVVPPQESDMRRPRGRLYEDLDAVIPEVGDTVRVSAFVRDDAERQLLKLGIDKHDGDPRFKWIRGSSGGARPARIRRERV
jgi:hypothetical protein